MTSRHPKMLWLPFGGLLGVWRSCYKNANEKTRGLLNDFDDNVSLREKRNIKGQLFVQLTQQELAFLKDSYELEI